MEATVSITAPSIDAGSANGYRSVTWAGTPSAAFSSLRNRSAASAGGSSILMTSAVASLGSRGPTAADTISRA